VEVTDTNGHFSSSFLEGVLDELYTLANSAGGITWNSIVTNTTASANNGYFVNTSAGEITITLPSSASIGDTINKNSIEITKTNNGENQIIGQITTKNSTKNSWWTNFLAWISRPLRN
jgi:hypothetical protein